MKSGALYAGGSGEVALAWPSGSSTRHTNDRRVRQATSRVRSRRRQRRDRRGVSNPRTGSGTATRQNRGVAHAPAPLPTVTRVGQARGTERRACERRGDIRNLHVSSHLPATRRDRCSSCFGVLGDSANFLDGDNHRLLSRLPSRRQQFHNRLGKQLAATMRRPRQASISG